MATASPTRAVAAELLALQVGSEARRRQQLDVTQGGPRLLGSGASFQTLVARRPGAATAAVHGGAEAAALAQAQVAVLGRFLGQYEAEAHADLHREGKISQGGPGLWVNFDSL